MITVSDSFKEAIKNANREIYGYVDVNYQKNDYDKSIDNIPTVLSIYPANGSGLIQGSKVINKYATLENNYALLDGSFILWNENVIDSTGFASDKVFNDIEDNTITISNDSPTTPVKGVTIYFKDNLPFDFNITFKNTDGNIITNNVVDNTSYVYQYVFENEIYLSEISLNVLNVEFSDNRLRIAYVDFNISDCYEGDVLISFDVTEELDLLVENLPTNTCTINITNYPDSNGANNFDVINPKGIVKYMTDDSTLEPYIGVSCENGVEYVPMGTFYLDDWSSDTDGSVTLNGTCILNKLKGKEMIWTNSTMFGSSVETPILSTMIKNTSDVICKFPDNSMPIDDWSNTHTNLFDYLTYISPCLLTYSEFDDETEALLSTEYRKLYVNRYNNIVLNKLLNTSVDKISREELLEDVKYTNKTPIKELIVNYTLTSSSSSTTSKTILNTNYTLTKTEEYLWFKVDDYIAYVSSASGTVLSGSATFTNLGYNMHLLHAKVTGTIGSTINIKYVANVPTSSQTNYTLNYTNDKVNTGDTLTLDFGECEIPNFDSIRTVFFDLDKHYNVSAETIGDPSTEIGDTVSIQTRYTDKNNGYKDILITKQKFTYDGGLSCSLEGIGD